MRTTVTLDPDVERLLRVRMREAGVSFKQALNDAARAGLAAGSARPAKRFAQRTFSLGAAREFRWDKALTLAAGMDDEERSRKLLRRT